MSKVEWIKPSDLCEQLNVTRSTYDRWRAKGALPRFRKMPGGHIVFDQRDVDEWLDSMLVSQ